MFCEQNNFSHFSSKEDNTEIYVQVPATFEQDKEDSDDSLLFATVKAFHTGNNRNHSRLTEKAAKECMKNMAYKPVLANFCEIDGVRDFTSHDMEFNDDGSITYIEKQVGCFTADKPYLEDDPDDPEHKFIMAKVAIPRDYTDAAEIIERKGGTKVSVELQIFDMSYDSSEHILILESVNVTGLALLGRDPATGDPVEEGMRGARLDIQDFSAENNSVIDKAQLINEITTAVIEQLSDKKADFSADYTNGKEEEVVKMGRKKKTDFEETEVKEVETPVVETEEAEVETTEEKPVVETESSEEEATEDTPEVVDKFEEEEDAPEKTEKFDGSESTEGPDEGSDGGSDGGSNGGSNGGSDGGSTGGSTGGSDGDHQSTSVIEDEDSTGTKVENSIEYSATYAGQTRTNYSTLNEQLEALWNLVNDMYGEADNEWYSVDADPDKRLVYMHGWTNHYRQSYKVKGDVYSLTGDRTPIYCLWASLDEKKELERIQSNYSAIESELNSYKSKELHTAREAVLASEDYSMMKDFEAFKELKENMDDYTVEELTNKADLVYAKFMKTNFAANTPAQSKMVLMTSGENKEEKKLPYGGLFKDFKTNK